MTGKYKHCILILKGYDIAIATVNISFQEDLLKQIDKTAKDEARTRSELIREAARIYIERKKKWESIFAYGESISSKYKFTEDDVNEEIRKYREEKMEKINEDRTLPKINTTYCVPKVVAYNSNPCGICPPVVLSLTSAHQLYEHVKS
ncbi:ribbon-helix-helix domain-containing protein [Treponema sp. TIM-1]|uniref:CopG family ribbon-helix-helix protein n=1 Tax=Treponema sp. TIM-1 TaxID=2898417 RepID=UPI00398153F2